MCHVSVRLLMFYSLFHPFFCWRGFVCVVTSLLVCVVCSYLSAFAICNFFSFVCVAIFFRFFLLDFVFAFFSFLFYLQIGFLKIYIRLQRYPLVLSYIYIIIWRLVFFSRLLLRLHYSLFLVNQKSHVFCFFSSAFPNWLFAFHSQLIIWVPVPSIPKWYAAITSHIKRTAVDWNKNLA